MKNFTKRELLDSFRLDNAPIYLLRLVLQRAGDIFAEEIGPDRVTLRQFMLLLATHQRPGLTQTELVEATGIDRSTVGDMLDRLVKRGFLRRRRSGRDQRANDVFILPAGLRALRQALPAAARVQARLLEPLPANMRAAFLVALRRIAGLHEADQLRTLLAPPAA